jgi:peptidyl-tRNA hydrolase
MEHKQVIVLRKDLNMRKGKMVAQGAHASMRAILNGARREGDVLIIPALPQAFQAPTPALRGIANWLRRVSG